MLTMSAADKFPCNGGKDVCGGTSGFVMDPLDELDEEEEELLWNFPANAAAVTAL